MSLFTDILKGLPENAVLRGKVANAEERYAALETENAILKDDLRDAKAEITKLKKQVEEFTHKDLKLNEKEIMILKVFGKTSEPIEDVIMASHCGLNVQVVKFQLQRLESSGYVSSYMGFYSLSYKGREYLIENNLI